MRVRRSLPGRGDREVREYLLGLCVLLGVGGVWVVDELGLGRSGGWERGV